jgi:hypothetical protein
MGKLWEANNEQSSVGLDKYRCPECGAICLIDDREGFEWKFCPIEGKEVSK